MKSDPIKVHLTWPEGVPLRDERPEFLDLIQRDRYSRYVLREETGSADLKIIVNVAIANQQQQFEALEKHPLVGVCDEMTFVYVENDEPACVYQGLYCSMPHCWMNPFRQRAVAYRTIWNPFISQFANDGVSRNTKWLFSFTGQANVQVRKLLLSLNHKGSKITDSTRLQIYNNPSKGRLEVAQKGYAEEILDSKFVLCPRGRGTSSFRLFEAMALGRVPVILSDQWVPPKGPDWKSFSLRVRERDALKVPQIIEAAEPQWEQMAHAARAAWEEWFAPDILFHRMVEACLDIKRNNILPERVWRRLPDPQQVAYRARGLAGRIKRAVPALRRKQVVET